MPRKSTWTANSASTRHEVGRAQGANEVFKALFADVMEGSTNTTVDPQQCIPLMKVRETV